MVEFLKRLMNSKELGIQSNESQFNFDEMFFSRTDSRGIIASGNAVFQRVSVYGWDELLGKPHNVIRHPDMPRAVFWLLWDTIKKGKPIGAYVKNRSKDGKYYWVFAVVTPIPSGFLSARIKPSSDLFHIVEQEYNNLLYIENSGDKIKPEESANLLVKRLEELGFTNYLEFMSIALGKEIQDRDKALGRRLDPSIEQFHTLLTNAKQLSSYADNIFQAYAESKYVPLNLRIQSAQLGEDGATIGVISNNYSLISNEIKEYLAKFTQNAHEVYKCISEAMFMIGTAKLQKELLQYFKKEAGSGGEHIDFEVEMEVLNTQQTLYSKNATDSLQEVIAQTEKFRKDCMEMKRLASSLEVVRVMGKVESSKLHVISDGLNELIDDLEVFQSTVSENLKFLEQSSRFTEHGSTRILKQFQRTA